LEATMDQHKVVPHQTSLIDSPVTSCSPRLALTYAVRALSSTTTSWCLYNHIMSSRAGQRTLLFSQKEHAKIQATVDSCPR
jgi:2-phospho-L-lactate transferase/gluconeogenesis factor (CofD/UPF0052 family)